MSYCAYLFPEGPYLGLGAGAYYLDYKDSSVDGNKLGLGGGTFLEINDTLLPEVVRRDLNNIQLLVGYRF